MSELGIVYFECIGDKVQVYPLPEISTRGNKNFEVRIPFPQVADDFQDFELWNWQAIPSVTPPGLQQNLVKYAAEIGITTVPEEWTSDEIKRLLEYIKTNYSGIYTAVTNVLKDNFNNWRKTRVDEQKAKAESIKLEKAGKVLSLTSLEDVYGITIKGERYVPVISGEGDWRVAKCPICGAELVRWR